MNKTDVSPEVQAVKDTGGKAQGEAAMKSEMAGQRKAARMVENKGMSSGLRINKQSGMTLDCCTPEYQQKHVK